MPFTSEGPERITHNALQADCSLCKLLVLLLVGCDEGLGFDPSLYGRPETYRTT